MISFATLEIPNGAMGVFLTSLVFFQFSLEPQGIFQIKFNPNPTGFSW